MAKVQSRPDNIIFAQSAQTGELSAFQNLERGWGSTLTYSAGVPPMEWFNFIGQRSDAGIHYVLQQGLDEWNNLETYPVGSLVKVLSDNCAYRALTENTAKSPTANGEAWVKVLDITAASAAARQVGRAAGNIIQIGAFGFGSNAETISSANSPTASGLYGLPATGAGGPVPGMATEIIHIQYDSANATQYAKGATRRTLYIRDLINGTWNGWEGQYGPSNKPTADELGINQNYIPMSGSESVSGNIGTNGWVHVARNVSDLFRAANSAGLGVSEISGNIAGSEAVQSRLTSVSVSAGSHTTFVGMWGSVAMTSIRQVINSDGSTYFNMEVCRAGSVADRRTTALQIDGGGSRVTTTNGFTLCENGIRVYSPSNPQPVDVSWAVQKVRLGAEYIKGYAPLNTTQRADSGGVLTGLTEWSSDNEIHAYIFRPIQMMINGVWMTVEQV